MLKMRFFTLIFIVLSVSSLSACGGEEQSPTIEATSTSLVIAVAQPTVTPLSDAVVKAARLNVRPGPGKHYEPVIAIIEKDTALAVVGQFDDCAWLKVITPTNIEGWVDAAHVDLHLGCAQIVVVTISATPTAAIIPTDTPTLLAIPSPIDTPIVIPTATFVSAATVDAVTPLLPEPTLIDTPSPTPTEPPPATLVPLDTLTPTPTGTPEPPLLPNPTPIATPVPTRTNTPESLPTSDRSSNILTRMPMQTLAPPIAPPLLPSPSPIDTVPPQ